MSVIIPTLRRARILKRVLDRLAKQDTPADAIEVVIGADALEPDLDAVASVTRDRPYDVRVVQATVPGVSAARNAAWPLARADVVLVIGDDMLPAPDLVGRHLAHHEAHPQAEAALLGHARWARELRQTAFMQWLDEYGLQFDYRTITGTDARFWHFYAANSSLKKERLEAVGGYDEDFRFGFEELDLAVRLDQIGLELTYDPEAEVEHLHAPTLKAWRRRMRTVAKAERQFLRKHPHLEPHFLPIFEPAAKRPVARGRGARFASFIPETFPWLGHHVWGSADSWFHQQLAFAYLESWAEAAPDD